MADEPKKPSVHLSADGKVTIIGASTEARALSKMLNDLVADIGAEHTMIMLEEFMLAHGAKWERDNSGE